MGDYSVVTGFSRKSKHRRFLFRLTNKKINKINGVLCVKYAKIFKLRTVSCYSVLRIYVFMLNFIKNVSR